MPESKDSATVVTKLLELARADSSYLQELERFRRALVIMFSDIQGSTAYFEKYGDPSGLLMVHQCNDTIRRLVEKHGGSLVKTIGDGTMSSFPQPRSAVEAAINIQAVLADVNSVRPDSERAEVRIGLHYGTGIVRTNDIFGDVVNTASRVESVAAAGQIVLSEAMYNEIREGGFRVCELGRFTLKGKSGERSLFQVIWNEAQSGQTDPGLGHSPCAPSGSFPGFNLQLVQKDGTPGAMYAVQTQLTFGRSEGDLRFAADSHTAPLNARVFVQDEHLFVEDLSANTDSVFVRIGSAHTLQHGDIILMGQQVFRFEEKPGAMSAVTILGATLVDITNALGDVAGLVRLDAAGKPSETYPINAIEVQFGRTRGTFVFPADDLMSRAHARVVQRGEDFLLEDAGSRNGTFVKVRGKAPLPVGSALLVGGQLLQVVQLISKPNFPR
jgi:adenylate cyclase